MKIENGFADVHSCYHISFDDGDPQEDEDAQNASPELKEVVKNPIDILKEVNLGDDDDKRPTYVIVSLNEDEERKYMGLFFEFKDFFLGVMKRC